MQKAKKRGSLSRGSYLTWSLSDATVTWQMLKEKSRIEIKMFSSLTTRPASLLCKFIFSRNVRPRSPVSTNSLASL